MMVFKRAVPALVLLAVASAAEAGPIDDLSASLRDRAGTVSLDRRHSETKLRVFGHDVKGGCTGDLLTAKIRITGASGRLSGDTAAMDVAYEGSFERAVCGASSETKRLFGHYLFHVTDKPFQKPVIAWGDLAPGFGESTDPQDEANRLAVEAVKNAVASAF
jgi:hypothetical protein